MAKRLLLLIGVIGLVLVSACSDDGGGGGGLLGSRATYEGDGYTLEYPEDWEVAEDGRIDTGSDVELINAEAESSLPPLVRVKRLPDMGHLKDVDAVAVSVIAELRPEVSDLTVSDQEETELEGADSAVSMKLGYTDEIEGTKTDVRELLVVARPTSDSDVVTVVRFVAPAKDFKELADTFQELAGTIQVE